MAEAELDALEEQIPALATEAGRRAHLRVLELGGVLIARDGCLLEVFNDGTETIIEEITPPTQVAVGTVIFARNVTPTELVADALVAIDTPGDVSCR